MCGNLVEKIVKIGQFCVATTQLEIFLSGHYKVYVGWNKEILLMEIHTCLLFRKLPT